MTILITPTEIIVFSLAMIALFLYGQVKGLKYSNRRELCLPQVSRMSTTVPRDNTGILLTIVITGFIIWFALGGGSSTLDSADTDDDTTATNDQSEMEKEAFRKLNNLNQAPKRSKYERSYEQKLIDGSSTVTSSKKHSYESSVVQRTMPKELIIVQVGIFQTYDNAVNHRQVMSVTAEAGIYEVAGKYCVAFDNAGIGFASEESAKQYIVRSSLSHSCFVKTIILQH